MDMLRKYACKNEHMRRYWMMIALAVITLFCVNPINAEVKTVPEKNIKTRGTIVDKRAVLFVIWASESTEKGEPRKVYRPQYSSNPGIVEVFRASFNYHWDL